MALFGNNRDFNIHGEEYFNKDTERQARLMRYKKTWAAYLAELDDPIVIDSMSNDNVKVNPARAIINTGVYFLFGSELKFQVSPDVEARFGTGGISSTDTTPNTADPAWLQDLNRAWKANRKQSFLFNMGLSGAIHGDVFVKFVPNGAGTLSQYPRLSLLDPANVDVEWDPNDCSRALKYCIEYITEDDKGKPTVYTQEIEAVQDDFGRVLNWTIQDYKHTMQYEVHLGWYPGMGERVPVGPEVIWPYAWAPVEHCQNVELPHMYWGLADLDESSVEVIESLQRAMSSLNKIIRIHASPRMFAKNVLPDQVEDIDVSADNIIALPNMEADLKVLETLTNLSPSIQFTDKLREDLLEMVQTPAIALGKFETASTSISGVTLAILYAPLLQKTELKRISYGDMVERINEKMLVLMGHTDPTEYESLVLVWPEAMPGSAYLERQTLQQDHQMGASSHTVMARLGYDPIEEENQRIAERIKELDAIAEVEAKYNLQAQSRFDVGGAPQQGGEGISLAPGQAPPNQPDPRGGNNNPSGQGNQNGSLGGTKAAGTPKSPKGQKNN